MKNIFYLISIISIALVSCSKEGRELPINNPNGNYFYTSNSTYYTPLQKIKFVGSAEGGIAIRNIDKGLSINVTPYFGYQYDIIANNLKVYGDTTTFIIPTQKIYLEGSDYNLLSTNNVEGPVGKCGGYITSDTLILGYRSNNISTLEYVNTKIGAKKNN